MTLSIHCGNWSIGKRSPSYAMNDSKTCRNPHKGTASHRKNKYLFQILPTLLCCSEWIQRQEGNREKASRKPQWKNYDFTMYLSRITTSHDIAVKWYLRVYWLLPLSIVASFKKHRRFFRRAPTILLLRTDDSFAEHRRFFCWAPWILGSINQLHFPKESFPYFNGLFFLHQLNQQTAWQKSYYINRHLPRDPPVFCWHNGHIEHTEPW